ncbi:hypothetical protein E8E13_002218 [Curvularia kusanoi]|uniref:RNA polymerase I-specific transcription initiation factor RRN6-like protein n=1 Tax=Curvularia kusanoi TaxID=90978 RepID=A0A9P4TF24_CURKU|nr:hypothetical protein E8E13_002218 [Curvularia kusanoi]
MADSSLNNLNYGRSGLTNYDLDNREWVVSRLPSTDSLQQVSEWQLSIPPAIAALPTTASRNATSSRKSAKRLAHDHPQLVAAATQLPDLNIVSEAITSAAAIYDPHVGDLLSFGTVYLKKFVRPKRIAAVPTGPSGSILRLIPLGQQRQGWEGDKSVWLNSPSFRIVDSGYWNEQAAPIQQVCFARTESGNSFLAVRLPSKSVLFRPIYHRGRRAAKPSPHYTLPPSLLSARPILELSLEQTGGTPHADLAFNPEYQFQFGVVDQRYQWSLWQIERRAKKEEYSVSCMVSGTMSPETSNVDDGDGWARIFWAGDSNTLIVCNRRQLCVVGLTGAASFELLQAPPIIPQRSTDWILDIRRHPYHQNRFFVLTSTRLFLIAVTSSSAALDSTVGHAGASILSSRRHYRGDEDLTLRMDVQETEATIYLFITSRLNKVTQVYQFQDRPSAVASIAVSTDPAVLNFQLPDPAKVMQIHLQPLEYGTKVVPQHRQSNATAQAYLQRSVPFHQLTLVLTDLSVHQTVVMSSEFDPVPEPLVWRRIVVAKHSLDATSDVDDFKDFVEPNGPDWDADPELKLKAQIPRLLSVHDGTSQYPTADQTIIYKALLDHHEDVKEDVSLEAVTDQLRDLMTGVSLDSSSSYLMEQLDAVAVTDVDEASLKLDRLITENSSQNTNRLEPIAASHILCLPRTKQIGVADLYDNILQDWIAPLPAETSIAVRQAKERLARRVAAEVTLASVHLSPTEEEREPSTSAPADSVSLPILPSKPADVLPSTLPTPPQSSVPPSSPLFPELRLLPSIDPLSRLRKYLTIDENAPMTPNVLAPSVSDLLSHWQPGADPSSYDWEATERALQPEAADEESQELLERERKRKEKREKRQRRENELLRAKTHTSGLPMYSQPAFPRSSPGPTFGGMAASSQVPIPASSQLSSQVHSHGGFAGGFGGMTSMLPQSQVEPGKFGGRPDKKKKKGKSRVSGF